MLTWDEAKEAVQKAQKTSAEEFARHLADYMVQGVIPKLIDDYVQITMRRIAESTPVDEDDIEYLQEAVAHEAAIFMTGVQVGWYMAEEAHGRGK